MKPQFARLPAPVVAGLVLAVVLDTFIQITWKLAVRDVPADASVHTTLRLVLSSPLFLAAMLAFLAQLWNWLRVLARADLSFAQPFTALSYLTVLGISAYSLHERISVSKMLGVALILLGVFFISRTPYRTLDRTGSGGAGPGSTRP